MFCQINRDKEDNIAGVMAPNGAKSLLYEDIYKSINVDNYVYDSYATTILTESLGDIDFINHISKKELRKELALVEWSRIYDTYGTVNTENANPDNYDANGEFILSKKNKVKINEGGNIVSSELKPIVKEKIQEITPQIEIKPGVAELFESNPELASIGTQQQYSQYLNTTNNPTIQGFKNFVQGTQFQKLTEEEKARTIEQVTKEHRSITALKDLSAKLAYRIGGTVDFVNRTDVDWKGYNRGMTSVLNEAYMTPDTPFHEILAHPIIRVLKKSKPELYQSLLKELETGRGKEVFEQVKRDYNIKTISKNYSIIDKSKNTDLEIIQNFGTYWFKEYNEVFNRGKQFNTNEELQSLIEREQNKIQKYILEEQQEEAIVTLLGLMAADKLDAKKDATLISKLKELWKQISDFVKSLLRQDGIRIDELPITTTLNDLAEIMAYGNNKIILPGYKVEYSTPLGNKYDTLEEVNQEIKMLSSLGTGEKIDNITPEWLNKKLRRLEEVENKYKEEGIMKNSPLYNELEKEIAPIRFIRDFIEKNKEYEQSKEIIEQWKKENNIQYDPEEVYSRGQGFYSSIGAYSNLEIDLLLKNLIQHIQDNKKAGGEFTISAFTKPIDKRLKHIEGTGDRVRFVIYPKSEHIKWAAPTDVYSGSVWDAHEKVSKDKKSELLGVSFTKAPALRNINEVSPNLADIIDNLSHAHNELGIELTTNNFRIEYDDNIDYSTKKLIDNINKILDDKYGKITKPAINSNAKQLNHVSKIEDIPVNEFFYSTYDDIFYYRKEKDGNWYVSFTKEEYDKGNRGKYPAEKQAVVNNYNLSVGNKTTGKQPTQTRENTTSIYSVKSKFINPKLNGWRIMPGPGGKNMNWAVEYMTDNDGNIEFFETEQEAKDFIKSLQNTKVEEKEYTSQALTNLKIAALKEVASKYPRSLITSKVVPINPNLVDNSKIQYSKVGTQERLNQIQDIFNKNPKLASIGTPEQYSQYLDAIFPDSEVKDIYLHQTNIDFKDIGFDKNKIGSNTNNNGYYGYGFYFVKDTGTPIDGGWGGFASAPIAYGEIEMPVILNIKKIKNGITTIQKDPKKLTAKLKKEGYDSINAPDGLVVFKSEQIHILGSKQDIEGFRKFISRPNQSDSQRVAQASGSLSRFIDNIKSKFNLNVNYITEFQAREILSKYNLSLDNRNAFVLNGQIYLIEGRVNEKSLLHEVGHLIIEIIYDQNKPLFEGLKKQITPELFERAKLRVVDPNNPDDIFKEAMAIYIEEYEKGFIERVWSFLSNLFSFIKGEKLDINRLSSLENIVDAIMTGKQSFDLGSFTFTQDKIYFQTREDSDILKKILSRKSDLTKKEDHSEYESSVGVKYKPVSHVITGFTGRNAIEEDLATHISNLIWDKRGIDPTIKLFTKDFPTENLNKNEYIIKKRAQLDFAVKKGKIIHMLRDATLEKDKDKREAIVADISKLANEVGIINPFKEFGWSVEYDPQNGVTTFKDILDVEGINILEPNLPESVKDKMFTEVTVYSDLLGWAGTIDSFYEHYDGTFSIIDLYTGSQFNKSIMDRILKYGSQQLEIIDNVKNRKKLQVLLYALIIKTENPQAKFKHLKVHWMPNEYTAKNKSSDMDVDVDSFLSMVRDYLIAENPELYAALKAKSPNIFDAREYTNKGAHSTLEVLQSNNQLTGKQLLEQLQEELTRLNNKQAEFISKNNRRSYQIDKNINEITSKILDLNNFIPQVRVDDESIWKKVFGQFGDFSDKKLQSFKMFMDSRRSLAEKEKAELGFQLKQLTDDLKKDYFSRKGGALNTLTLGGIDGISYKDLYGNLFQTKKLGDLNFDVLKLESDPSLTTAEKNFVKFISVKMKKYNQEILTKIAYYNHKDKPVTYLDILKQSYPGFDIDDMTFIPRVPMLDEELREEAGFFSKDHMQKLKSRLKQQYLMSENNSPGENFGMPLKYFGTPELIDSEAWSRNLEYAFVRFTENMIDKKYMDDVYAYGKGITTIYQADVDAEGRPKAQNNLQFLEDKLLLDIINRKDYTDVSRSGFRLTENGRKINTVAIFGALRKLTSSQIMWLKPIQGLANGVMARLITKRRALVTSLAGEGSFGYKDTLRADLEMVAFTKDMVTGNLQNNKTFLLLKQLDYLPSDFGFNTPSTELNTAKNKLLSVGNMYLTHTLYEKHNAAIIMLAQLNRMKTTKDGIEVSMLDAYEVVQKTDPDTGTIYNVAEYKGDVRGIELDSSGNQSELTELTSKEISKLKRVYQQMQGGYRADERTTMELYWYGQLFMQFRKYLPSIIIQAVKSKNLDYTLGRYEMLYNEDGSPKLENGKNIYQWVAEETEGSLWVLLKSWINLVTFGSKYKNYSLANMKEKGQYEKVRSFYEGSFTALTFILAKIALAGLFPDDDDEKDELRLMMNRVVENYSQHYNPIDWFKTLKSPPASVSRLWLSGSAVAQMITAAAYLTFGDEDNAYTRFGRIKGGTEAIKSIPILASIYAFHKFIGKAEITEESEFAKWFEENLNLAR